MCFHILWSKCPEDYCARIFWSPSSWREVTGMLKQYTISILVIQRHSPGNCSNLNSLCWYHKLGGCLTVVLARWAGTGVMAAVENNRTGERWRWSMWANLCCLVAALLLAWLSTTLVLSWWLKAISLSWWLFEVVLSSIRNKRIKRFILSFSCSKHLTKKTPKSGLAIILQDCYAGSEVEKWK